MKEEFDLSPDEAVGAAVQLEDAGRIDDAEGLLRAVLKIDPRHFHALNRLGALLALKRKSYYEALYRFDRALRIDPASAMARSNLGMVLSELGHNDEAAGQFRKAVDANPKSAVYWSNFGNTLERLQDYADALEALSIALDLDPENATTRYNLGIVLLRLNRRAEGIAYLDEAIRREPEYPDAYYNRGIARLTLGDYRGGFADYEYRLKTAGQVYYIGPFEQPKWTGAEPIAGKTILVHGEQGLGDSIQFMRYVPMLIERGANVVMVLHTALKALVTAHFPSVTVLDPKQEYPAFDYYVPLMSLALCFGTTVETIPAPWEVDVAAEPRWLTSEHTNIGLCWSGNQFHKNDDHRSMPLAMLEPIFKVGGVRLVSLQKDVRDIDGPLLDTSPVLHDTPSLVSLKSTAGLIQNLDLVITVDTAVAHLAASIGKPTWILLPAHATDWRWMADRSESPWYPSVRLFRQAVIGDWSSVVDEVKRALEYETCWRPPFTAAPKLVPT